MSGPERAAALLVALGPDVAADILKNLDQKSIDRLMTEVVRIQNLPPNEKEDLVGEFLIDLKKLKHAVTGGEGKAREILSDAFGQDKASQILNKLDDQDVDKAFEFLKDVAIDQLAFILKDEHPQLLAVTLSNLPPAKSGKLMKAFAPETAKTIAIRMAKMKKVAPETIVSIARGIKFKYEKFLREQKGGVTSAEGVDRLINILGHMNFGDEKKVLDSLEKSTPGISSRIKEKIFAFENVLNLDNKEIRILIEEIHDDKTIALALKGAGDEIRFKFLRNMSRDRANDILDDMKIMGPVRLTDVEDSRGVIVDIMRELHDNGVLQLRKDKEIYVE